MKSQQKQPRYSDSVDNTKRLPKLESIAREHGWRLTQDVTMRMLDGSSLYSLAIWGRQYQNFIFSNDWEYVEVRFRARGQTGLNRFKSRWVRYAVMRSALPRKLPNVVFDSLEHQRRQFRIVFDSKQYIQLEGNFNTYFGTYFGKKYTIDDLSFITPEVMEALIAAKNYDIEIVHDSLLLFGQIQSDPEAQLLEMSKAIKLIHKKLLNNILTYRDERVPYDKGRKVVARAGMFLEGQSLGTLFILLFIAAFYLILFAIISMVTRQFIELL